jgi:phosphatidylserine/phosphatidylglycerophosphate/cardiolipin synthase-like enzyme
MTTLDELKQKWFIDTTDSKAFPPQERHPGSLAGDHTDGNLVTPLIDGSNIMGYFHDRVEQMLASDDPRKTELWLAAMGIEQVQLRGIYRHSKGAMNEILDAARDGIRVSFLASGQANLAINSKKFIRKLIDLGGQGTVDNRFPFISGHHQKFYVTYKPDNDWEAVVGSADFFTARWDTREHLPVNPHRPGGPTHDMAVMVKGPATVDVALTFAERWNDLKTSEKTDPPIKRALSTAVDNPPPEVGTHSVQVLRTYPLMKEGKGFSWSTVGEYTVWASYINAIKQAQTYIYIEDQYLYPLGDPPFIYSDTGRKRETDFVYQLGEALKRGVDVVALVPERDSSLLKHYENQHRRRATEYLDRIAKNHPGAGRFVVVKLNIDGKDITIHSKVMLVDDEFALVGTANICQRSIAYITEINLGMIDAQNELVRDLRLDLWAEHMELAEADSLTDPRQAVGLLQEEAQRGGSRLHLYPTKRFKREFPYAWIMNNLIDPYSGPER